jgi:hypothetical protein
VCEPRPRALPARPSARRPSAAEDVSEDARRVLADLAKAGGSKVEPAYDPNWLPELDQRQQHHNSFSRSTPVTAQAASEYVEQLEPPSVNGHKPDSSYPESWLTEAERSGQPNGGLAGEGWLTRPEQEQ